MVIVTSQVKKKKKQYKNLNNIESKELVQVYFIINIFVYSLRT